MFFNLRSRSNADLAKKVQAAERDKAAREAAAAKRAPPAKAGLTPARTVTREEGGRTLAGFSDSTMQEVLNSIEEVPRGEPLPYTRPDAPIVKGALQIPYYYKDFSAVVVVQAGEHPEVVVLLTPEGAVDRGAWDLRDRLVKAGYRVRNTIMAVQGVISSLHESVPLASGEDEPDSELKQRTFSLLYDAVVNGASDLHIATRRLEKMVTAEVSYRIHGKMIRQTPLPASLALDMMRVLYNVHSDKKNTGTAWIPAEVQDTAIEHRFEDGTRVQVRFNSVPIYPGDNVGCTMRLLRMDGAMAAKELEDVGYTPEQVAAMEEMLVGATGLVLLVGPTNSGKSTTIQSLIRRMYRLRGSSMKLVTIEDPVEYIVPGAWQMPVPRGTRTAEEIAAFYVKLLGASLRQDPDAALVGEIRTAEQAEPVKDMVLAGRKILSTLHAYEALAAIPRLAEIGIPNTLLTRSGFLSGVIYQRLVPLLCPNCKIPLTHDMVAQGHITAACYERTMTVAGGVNDTVYIASRTGCEHCKRTGVIGRTPCAEILVPDEEFLSLMRAGREADARNYWLRTGINAEGCGVRAVGHAITKVRKGLVDPRDAEEQIGPLVLDRLFDDPRPKSSAYDDRGFVTGQAWAAEAQDDPMLTMRNGRNQAFLQS